MARVFNEQDVSTPRTLLLASLEEVVQVLHHERDQQWVLKWPTGCGGSGHRLLRTETDIPDDWPRPYILQEFIRLEKPEVYRLYGVKGETFGWNVRRFPEGRQAWPFVAHAQGAHYEDVGEAPPQAEHQARLALEATNLLDSFGCADLMQDANGVWRVLEVNTDGVFNHVDRDTLSHIAQEIDERLAQAWRAWL